MIVTDLDEAQEIADEMRRGHFGIGIIGVTNQRGASLGEER
jgi:hypothetical protein